MFKVWCLVGRKKYILYLWYFQFMIFSQIITLLWVKVDLPRNSVAGLYGSSIFNILRNIQMVFQSCLQSHQQFTNIPTYSQPCHFKQHSSVAFKTFTVLWNYHFHLGPRHFTILKGNLEPINSNSPFQPIPIPWQSLICLLIW